MMKNKLKIMKNKPVVPDDEIHVYMNFEELMTRRETVIHELKKRSLVIKGGAVLAVVGIVAFLFWYLNTNNQNPSEEKSYIEPLVKINQADTLNSDLKPAIKEPIVKELTPTKSALVKENKKETDFNKRKPIEVTSTEVIEPIYTEAEPLDGYPSLYNYFNNELVYPQDALKDSIQGILTVLFTINKDGVPENIKIQNSLGKSFDDEATRIIRNMPAWRAATVNGKSVSSKISVPLTFHLKKVISR